MTDHETLGGRIPKSERRVRFADSIGMELVSIFLTDLFVLASQAPYSYHHHHHQNQHQHQHHNHHHHHHLKQPPSAHIGTPFKPSPPSAPLSISHTKEAAAPLPPPTEFFCEFTQPVSLISFKERVKLKKVQLENCYINTTAGHVSLTCNIRVLNISYDKSVSVRYTTDDWRTQTDSLASYKPGSCDGWSDQFTSTISIINKLQPGQRIIFAVRFASGRTVYWDNNGGLNYAVKSA